MKFKKILFAGLLILFGYNLKAQTWLTSGTNIYNSNSGKVGIGTSAPIGKLTIANADPDGLGIYRDQDVNSIGPAGIFIDLGARNGSTFTPGAQLAGILGNPATTGYMTFSTRTANALTPKMIITSDGNVGIGTTTPGGNLLNINSGVSPLYSQLKIQANNTGSLSFLNYSADNSSIGFDVDYSGGWLARSTSAAFIYKMSNFLAFYGNSGLTSGSYFTPTIRMGLDLTTGNFGIGTITPATKFNVVGYEGGNWITKLDNNGTSGHQMYFGYNDGAITHGLYISGGKGLAGQIDFGVGNKFFVMGDGKVGIGTTAPVNKLSNTGVHAANVDGLTANVSALNWTSALQGYTAAFTNSNAVGDNHNAGLLVKLTSADVTDKILDLESGGLSRLRVLGTGNVGIGTTDPKGYKLAVNGSAIFTKAVVKLNANWPDYVFHKDYKLPTLEEIERFIKLNKHLPDVPTAKEVEKNGLDLGDNQALLLKKIEELTLIIIQLNKESTEIKTRLKKLEKTIN